MSELTFNIADYRPLARVRNHGSGPALKPFVVLSSNSGARELGRNWLDRKPEVVEICSVREAHRTYPRRGKILRFADHHTHRLYMMPAHNNSMPMDDDPGPMVA